MSTNQKPSGPGLLTWLLGILFLIAVGIIIYLKVTEPHPCFPGYVQLNTDEPDPQYIMLVKESDTVKLAITAKTAGAPISRTVGIKWIEDYQKNLHDTVLRYVEYDLQSMFNYIGYVLTRGRASNIGIKDLGIRVFLAKNGKQTTMPSHGSFQTVTTLFAPLVNGKLLKEFTMKNEDWDFYDEGSICPYCPDDPTGTKKMQDFLTSSKP